MSQRVLQHCSDLLSIGQVADMLRCLLAALQQECLGHIGDMEAAMVKAFPYEVPSEFKDLPQLKVCSWQAAAVTLHAANDAMAIIPTQLFACLCGLHGSAGPAPACWHVICLQLHHV